MPLLIDTESRTGTLVAAINQLLAAGGSRALSLRAIARESRVSGSSILHHYGSMEHLLRVAAHWTGLARRERIAERWRHEGLLAFLPLEPDDVVEARVWLAWGELWRSDVSLELVLQEAHEEERAMLARFLDHECSGEELHALTALIDGLTIALCRPARPLPLPRARRILQRGQPTDCAASRSAATIASGSSAE